MNRRMTGTRSIRWNALLSLPCRVCFFFCFIGTPFCLFDRFLRKKRLLHFFFQYNSLFFHSWQSLLVTVCPFLRFCQGIIAAQCMPVGNQAVIAVHGLAGNDLHNGLNGEFFQRRGNLCHFLCRDSLISLRNETILFYQLIKSCITAVRITEYGIKSCT